MILCGTTPSGAYVVRCPHALGDEITVFHRGEHEVDLTVDVRRVHSDVGHPPRELHPAPDVVVHMWAMTELVTQLLVAMFRGIAGRSVVISGGDVDRTYGRPCCV